MLKKQKRIINVYILKSMKRRRRYSVTICLREVIRGNDVNVHYFRENIVFAAENILYLVTSAYLKPYTTWQHVKYASKVNINTSVLNVYYDSKPFLFVMLRRWAINGYFVFSPHDARCHGVSFSQRIWKINPAGAY